MFLKLLRLMYVVVVEFYLMLFFSFNFMCSKHAPNHVKPSKSQVLTQYGIVSEYKI